MCGYFCRNIFKYLNMKKLLTKVLLVLFLLTGIGAWAQNGSITGKVTDKKTGEELIGVSVSIEGTSFGASSDIQGNFTISNVKPGTYTVNVSYVGYVKKVFTGVEVASGKPTTINASIEESTKQLNEVVVQAELKKENANSLLIQQKNSLSVSDGISADLIKKSPDATTSDVMKRVSGATVQDNKFAVIRGLNDRYNSAYINGAPLPSTEADRKAFSFDIFPSNMLANMTITKTATPDLPGDFAGGLITINTRDIPDEKFISLSLGGSIHSITTFKEGYTYDGGKTDWLGLDDGTRAIPGGLPGRREYEQSTSDQKLEFSNKFSDNWSLRKVNAFAPNTNFQVSGGNKYKFGQKNEFGFIVSLSHSNSYRFSEVERNQFQFEFDANNKKIANQQLYNYTDSLYKREVLVGAMLNFAMKLGSNNKFFFKNAYTINSEDQTTQRWGKNNMNNDPVNYENKTAYFFQQNLLLTNQLGAEHFITATKMKVKWVLNYNNIQRDIPDFRRFTRSTTLNPNNNELNPYTAQIGAGIDLVQNGRLYTKMNEQLYSGGADVQMPVGFLSGKKVKTEFKTGGFYQLREREFEASVYGHKINYNDPRAFDIVTQGLDSIFRKSNLYKDGFYIDEKINPQDKYTASSRLTAAYAMFTNRLWSRTRVVYGVRMESYNQRLETRGPSGDTININTTVTDFLPSVNFAYELTSKTNIRLAYFKSVARPEFRELAPFIFYDFNMNVEVGGTPSLQRTVINNYDFRIEHFVGEGQLVSFSLFYKDFTNAIEPVFEVLGGGSYRMSYSSRTNAINQGFEIELRKDFREADKWFGTKFMKNFMFNANYALIKSEVDLSNASNGKVNSDAAKRPLQGQSNYLLNLGLNYTDPKTQIGVNLLYNKIGRRIFTVQDVSGALPNVWENPRDVIDLSVSKRFFKKLDVKLTFSDILAQDLVFYQDNNKNGKFDNDENNAKRNALIAKGSNPNATPQEIEAAKEELVKLDNVINRFKMGRIFSLGVSYKF